MAFRTPQWESEFTEFFLGRQRTLMRTAYAMLGNPAAAEDAVQTTFVAIYARWPRIRTGNPEAYARRALINTCIAVWRSRRREFATDRVPEQPVAADHQRAELVDVLTQLPEQDRAVIALRFLEDLSVREVAQVLQLPEGTVKSRTARALARLETSLAQPIEGN
ncbi:SigE family RNA polymerase sigma factor [Flexivirga oryzae]|uniref:RNA polymerase sigma-70 factor (Sigma-E family) n=1 Tax=Flexivirga oryzae TaxID=1794944 RepID=A0A839MY55_9MICO|nr:SigE family RNA polymerase sigma factor [Flexivirga oryzae]MBB2890338.1 RNA polymerase sigma-70 factor (sigma-E family) [Flexivirga oryzae]